MTIDPVLLQKLIDQYKTPLFVYSAKSIKRRIVELFSVLPKNSRLFYSVKANPLPSICQIAKECGCYAEVASVGEIRAALNGGFLPNEILFGGPGKSPFMIEQALNLRISNFSVESFVELERLEIIATNLKRSVRVLLRINPSTLVSAGLKMSGTPSQFGIDTDQIRAKLKNLKLNSSYVTLQGFHIYFGTQITKLEELLKSFETSLKISDDLREVYPNVNIMNLGGGFPWPYASEGETKDIWKVKQPLQELILSSKCAEDTELWFESGRFISASSGSLITQIVDIKSSRGKTFVVMDAGINHLGGMSGLKKTLKAKVEVEFLEKPTFSRTNMPLKEVTITGPLCTPLDTLVRDLSVHEICVGDVALIRNVGAYGLTASLTSFLSHFPPCEIVIDNDKVTSVHQLAYGHKRIG